MSHDKPVHVVHLVYAFSVGGLERIIANVINHLPAESYHHTIIALTQVDTDFMLAEELNCEFYALHKAPGTSVKLHGKVFRLLRKIKPQVLQTYNLACVEFHPIAFLAGVPVRIHAEHGRDINDPSGSNNKYKLLRRVASWFTHHVIAVSLDLHQWLINEVKVSARKAKLILNGVDTQCYQPVSTERYPPLVFGHVARLSPIKNQHNLIAAYAQACTTDSQFARNTQLSVVGDGELSETLQQQVASLASDINVRLQGQRHDMPQVYQAFDVFVLSSDAEGIPMTMLEAMASGLPVLSTNVGGIPAIVTAQSGFLLEPQSIDALAKGFLSMYAYRSQWQKMGKAARERIIEQFSQQKMLADYAMLYQGR